MGSTLSSDVVRFLQNSRRENFEKETRSRTKPDVLLMFRGLLFEFLVGLCGLVLQTPDAFSDRYPFFAIILPIFRPVL